MKPKLSQHQRQKYSYYHGGSCSNDGPSEVCHTDLVEELLCIHLNQTFALKMEAVHTSQTSEPLLHCVNVV